MGDEAALAYRVPYREVAAQGNPLARTQAPDEDQLWVLMETLAIAVPLAIAELAELHPTIRDLRSRHWLSEAATLVAHHGDALLWPSQPRRRRTVSGCMIPGSPGTAGTFVALAHGIAAAAFADGGITWHGAHWCTTPHAECPNQRAEDDK